MSRTGSNATLLDREDAPDNDGDGEPDWFTVYDFDGRFGLVQPYVQTQYRLTEKIQFNAGLHGQYENYFRWDVKLGLKLNSSKRKLFHQFFPDFQNVTNRENVFARQYNRLTDNVDQTNQIGFFPDFLYRVQF